MASRTELEDASNEGVGESVARLEPVEAFVKGMTGQVNANDVARMVSLQQHMLSRFEKTNEMLLNFNHLSENRFLSTQLEFKKHIQLLVDTKKDLESVFKRIRFLKDKLRVRHPEAFAACAQVYHVPDDDSPDDEDGTCRDAEQHTVAISASAATNNSMEQTPNVTELDSADNCRGPTLVVVGPSDSDAVGLVASELTLKSSERVQDDDICHTQKATVES